MRRMGADPRQHGADDAMTVLFNIDVPDVEAATTFYTAAFGLTVGRRYQWSVAPVDNAAPTVPDGPAVTSNTVDVVGDTLGEEVGPGARADRDRRRRPCRLDGDPFVLWTE